MTYNYYFNIKSFRIFQNLTQEQLANMVNISQSYISQIERNNLKTKKGVRLGLIQDIAAALDVPLYKVLILDTKIS